MDTSKLEKLRRLGLTEQSGGGKESVRMSAQFTPTLFNQGRDQRREVLDRWGSEIQQKIAPYGGEVIPDSLSVSGQTLEFRIPVESADAMQKEIAAADTRIDPLVTRQVTPAE